MVRKSLHYEKPDLIWFVVWRLNFLLLLLLRVYLVLI